MLDIHKYDRKLERSFILLEESNICESNKKHIQSFARFSLANGISKPRVIKYLCYLKQLSELLGKDFEIVERQDIEKILEQLSCKQYSPWTVQSYKVIIKLFFKWLYGNTKEYPEIVSWINISISKNKSPRRMPNEFPTADDIVTLVTTAKSIRDKAFIACLGESGCRIGEIGNLAIRHVSFDKNGALLNVQGKTGFRPVRVVYSTYYLKKWFQEHPLKDKPDSPVWINTKGKLKKQISHQRLYELLQKTAKKSGLTKKVNPHSFRHGRGTFLSHFLTGYQLCNYMGWVPESKMPSVYIHMTAKDTNDMILQLNNIKTTNNIKENNMQVQRCKCEELVPITEICDCNTEELQKVVDKIK